MRDRKILCPKIGMILTLLASCMFTSAADKASHKKGISSTNYHGWADSLLLNNGTVEAVIVPAIGRVMQFHFVGEDDILWENEKLQGQFANPMAKEWANFGGDKSW